MTNEICILAKIALYKLDDSDIFLSELLAFNTAMIDLAHEHGLEMGGTLRLYEEPDDTPQDTTDEEPTP